MSCVISTRSLFFMYKGNWSLYTLNIVASHNTWKGFLKRLWLTTINSIKASSSGFDLSTCLISFIGPYASYTTNKHKLILVYTLFCPIHFIIQKNTTKENISSEIDFTRCLVHAIKVLRARSTDWTSTMGIGTRTTSQTSSTPTFTI